MIQTISPNYNGIFTKQKIFQLFLIRFHAIHWIQNVRLFIDIFLWFISYARVRKLNPRLAYEIL